MREAADRFHMLEQLADHDDVLLEQLLEGKAPSQETVLADLASETASNLVVPVLFGSATTGFGIRRLLKMLRHDTPHPDRAADRRSEEQTSELQSLMRISSAVLCLEKKNLTPTTSLTLCVSVISITITPIIKP